MSEYSWTEISLETVGCIILLVVAYKLYRMKLTTESDCCGGAVHVQANNPGNDVPIALQGVLGTGETFEGSSKILTIEDLEKIVQSKLKRSTNDFNSDLAAIRELKRSTNQREPPSYPRPLTLAPTEKDSQV